MDPVATYTRIEIQAQDVMVDDVWIIPCLETGFHVRASQADKGKPFWVLEGRDRGRKVQSVHNPRAILVVMRPSDDEGEFVEEHGEVHIDFDFVDDPNRPTLGDDPDFERVAEEGYNQDENSDD